MHRPQTSTSPHPGHMGAWGGVVLAGLLALVSLPGQAAAHTGGLGGAAEATVQAPAWVVWLAGAIVVGLTFALIGAFATRSQAVHVNQPQAPGHVRGFTGPRWLQGLVLIVLALVGLNGVVSGTGGLLPEVTVWLVAWAGLPLVAYLVIDPWPALSPFALIGAWIEHARGEDHPPLAYPAWLGSWPATLTLLALVGLEVWGGWARDPTWIGRLVLAYTAWTTLGMALFGARAWLSRAEILEQGLAWWGAISPLSRTRDGIRAQAPASRLGTLAARDTSEVALILVLLYGVNLDGLVATTAGQAVLTWLSPLGRPGAFTALLITGYVAFLAAFGACTHLVTAASDTLRSPRELAARFAVSLLPIAVGYHLAHNLLYLIQGLPAVTTALLDPLGLGWQLLPALAPFQVPVAWGTGVLAGQMLLIVAGHVVAVVAAHDAALSTFPSRLQAMRSEVPLALVMIAYTMVGLWIVSLGQGPGVVP